MKFSKNYRVLRLYVCFEEGKCININQAANEFQVNVRTIQRDIADIRASLADEIIEKGYGRIIIYNRIKNEYLIDI
ncbi:hypothetical protein ACTNDG_12365 [Clostridium sp. HCP1S3_B4]|uniref:hypothetical protein n=1 Tax=unclassified Clostridium TaxID=2614128 RepID=UPI003F88D36F